jgi:hypothetical protein
MKTDVGPLAHHQNRTKTYGQRTKKIRVQQHSKFITLKDRQGSNWKKNILHKEIMSKLK